MYLIDLLIFSSRLIYDKFLSMTSKFLCVPDFIFFDDYNN